MVLLIKLYNKKGYEKVAPSSDFKYILTFNEKQISNLMAGDY